MENVLTPEEANKAVTYGDLMTILGSVIKDLSTESIKYSDFLQENTFKIIDKTTENIVQIRDDAEYKRVRDINFILSYLAANHMYNNGKLYDMYDKWCKDFDELNKPKPTEEKKDD